MRTRAKPLFIALALALGASAPAFAQSSGDAGGYTNSRTMPPAVAPTQVNGMSGAPVTTEIYGTTTTIVTPAPSATVVTPAPSAVVVSPSATPAVVAPSDDARERAARVSTDEEEHGGVRNRIKAKKERTREKLGLGRDDD